MATEGDHRHLGGVAGVRFEGFSEIQGRAPAGKHLPGMGLGAPFEDLGQLGRGKVVDVEQVAGHEVASGSR